MQKYLIKILCRTMATTSASQNIKTFVFFDIETTGLPLYENNTTKITEISLCAVQASHISLGVYPRVQNKLNFCLNPFKLISREAETMTGLTNFLLEESCAFSQETVTSISKFLDHNPKPVCLVAHNGFKFDYPILKREIERAGSTLGDTILCIDSLIAFRELLNNVETVDSDTVDNAKKEVPLEFTSQFDQLLFSCEAQQQNETTPIKQIINKDNSESPFKKLKVVPAKKSLDFGRSLKLVDIFKHLTKKDPINAHQAEADVQMLILCAATLGQPFVDWSNNNAKLFSDIPAMVPGKRIGT